MELALKMIFYVCEKLQ